MQTKIAIDVTELNSEIVFDALLAERGEVIKTARGRKAILVGQAALTRLKKEYSLNLEDGTDGTVILR